MFSVGFSIRFHNVGIQLESRDDHAVPISHSPRLCPQGVQHIKLAVGFGFSVGKITWMVAA